MTRYLKNQLIFKPRITKLCLKNVLKIYIAGVEKKVYSY